MPSPSNLSCRRHRRDRLGLEICLGRKTPAPRSRDVPPGAGRAGVRHPAGAAAAQPVGSPRQRRARRPARQQRSGLVRALDRDRRERTRSRPRPASARWRRRDRRRRLPGRAARAPSTTRRRLGHPPHTPVRRAHSRTPAAGHCTRRSDERATAPAPHSAHNMAAHTARGGRGRSHRPTRRSGRKRRTGAGATHRGTAPNRR